MKCNQNATDHNTAARCPTSVSLELFLICAHAHVHAHRATFDHWTRAQALMRSLATDAAKFGSWHM